MIKNYSYNGINYRVEKLIDGWYRVLEINEGIKPKAILEARTLEKAIDYMEKRGVLDFPAKRL